MDADYSRAALLINIEELIPFPDKRGAARPSARQNGFRPGSSHVPFIDPLDAKTGILNQFVNRAVQVTAAG